ncbi:MAG: hypothetical protein ABI605_17775 [Rhizobacter sp.]
MRNKESHLATWPAISLYVLCIAYCLGIHYWWLGLGSSEKASWVQAVGSVLAIGVTGALGLRQFREARDLQHDASQLEDFRRFAAVRVVTDNLHGLCGSFLRAAKAVRPDTASEFFSNLSPHEFERARVKIERFSYVELPHPVLIITLDFLVWHITRFSEVMRSCKSDVANGNVNASEAIETHCKFAEQINERVLAIMEICDYHLARLPPYVSRADWSLASNDRSEFRA